jgi:hypothetical protein
MENLGSDGGWRSNSCHMPHYRPRRESLPATSAHLLDDRVGELAALDWQRIPIPGENLSDQTTNVREFPEAVAFGRESAGQARRTIGEF